MSQELAVTLSGQLRPEDIQALADKGIKSVVNNRPDHEEADQPTSAEIAAACQKLGIAYCHIPFAGGAMQTRHAQEFADFYNAAPKPVHVFCRTGNRSNGLILAAVELDLLDD